MVTNGPLAFEELFIGEKWTSGQRTIVHSDLLSFAELTGDHDPLHTDPVFASEGPFGRPIAHGLLGLSIMAGLSSSAPSVLTAALIDVRSWTFSKPIYVGDSIFAVTEVIDLKDRGRRHGEVHWYRQLFNQKGDKVQDGILITLVARRVPLPTKKSQSFSGIDAIADSVPESAEFKQPAVTATF
jgi:3-hydroxybutyryl-CoA dehydratase